MTRKSVYAIRNEDALTWHRATPLEAGISQRAGFRLRSLPGGWGWEVWATTPDFSALQEQARAAIAKAEGR